MPEPLVEIRNAHFSYANGVQALGGVDLDIERGQICSLVGPSGCGKSTLVAVLCGMRVLTHGTITWKRSEGEKAQFAARKRRPLSVVFQRDTVYPWLTVEKNVGFGLRYLDLERAARKARVQSLLEMVGLEHFRTAFPSELSGGMLRRVALLTAVSTHPSLLMLDEAFSALDEFTRVGVHADVLRVAYELKMSVLIVTHDLGEALSLSDQVYVMTGRPTRVAELYDIPFGRSRDISSVRESPEYQNLYSELWHRSQREFAANKLEPRSS